MNEMVLALLLHYILVAALPLDTLLLLCLPKSSSSVSFTPDVGLTQP